MTPTIREHDVSSRQFENEKTICLLKNEIEKCQSQTMIWTIHKHDASSRQLEDKMTFCLLKNIKWNREMPIAYYYSFNSWKWRFAKNNSRIKRNFVYSKINADRRWQLRQLVSMAFCERQFDKITDSLVFRKRKIVDICSALKSIPTIQ
jgi:hypothetical protein